MEYKLLNFPDAMKVTKILGKYISINAKKDSVDFWYSVFSKMQPTDILDICKLILVKDIFAYTPDDVISFCSLGLNENGIFLMIETRESIGL